MANMILIIDDKYDAWVFDLCFGLWNIQYVQALIYF